MSQMLSFYGKKKCITIYSADQQHQDQHFRYLFCLQHHGQ